MRFPGAAWDSIPDLPKSAISLLSETFTHSTSKVRCCSYSARMVPQESIMRRQVDTGHVPLVQVVQAQHSADGETTKLLLQLQDGLTVESVIMHYDTTGSVTCCNRHSSWHYQ